MKKTKSTPAPRIKSAMTRRKFVETTAVAGGALVAAPFLGGKAPAYAQARKVHYLQWTSFVPAADAEVDRQAKEFTKATGIEMTVEKINQNDMAARITAAVESGSGADVIQMNANQPHLFANGLADDNAAGRGAGRWRGTTSGRSAPPPWMASPGACPLFNIGNAIVYRKDVFEELGLTVPNTWDEYLEVGRALKNNNLPVGQTLGHTFGDAPTFAYPLMWSFGGQEVDELRQGGDQFRRYPQGAGLHEGVLGGGLRPRRLRLGRHQQQPRLPGPDHRRDLERCQHLFRGEEHPGRLPWAWPRSSTTSSIRRARPAVSTSSVPRTLSIMDYSPNKEAAAEYIRWSSQDDNLSEFITVNQGYVQGVTPKWEDHPVWQSDPAIAIYATNPRYGRTAGYAGPWNRQSGEAQEKYIIVDMFARAARGEDPEAVAAWAQSELENIYGA